MRGPSLPPSLPPSFACLLLPGRSISLAPRLPLKPHVHPVHRYMYDFVEYPAAQPAALALLVQKAGATDRDELKALLAAFDELMAEQLGGTHVVRVPCNV